MERKLYTTNGTINLLYATEQDRRLIYDLTFEDKEVTSSMFHAPSDFHWAEIRDEKDVYFDAQEGLSKYVLIEYEEEIIGVFCHVYHDAPIKNMELHIWMRSMKYTGRGFGTQVLTMMLAHLQNTFAIRTFLMRPWIRNERAIHTYQKCGFHIVDHFELDAYFSKEEIELHGNGAYTKEETVNMVRPFTQE